MGGGAPTGWLGVGRPVGPPVPWPRDMHRALPAPGRVSSSSTSRVLPSTVVGALGAGTVPRSGPAGRGPGTTFFSTRTSILLSEAYAPNIAHLAISLREAAGVWISLDAFEPTPRPLDGISRCSPVAWESAYVSSTTPLRRVPWPCLMLVFAPRAAISPSHTPPSTAGGHF